MDIKQKIEALIAPIIEQHRLFLIDIVLRGERQSKVLEVFIDNREGITAEICSNVSRDIAKILDLDDVIAGKYYLNVSSPGISRALKYIEQYHKHVGRLIELKLKKQEELYKAVGKLLEVSVDSIAVENESGDILKISFDNIFEANIKAAW
ncbi:MAG: ribosome maturation factor RimP [Bacteroidota bacterium]|nr:ribosome maturation factor RimP [Bacteroidota bacterium]